MILKPRILFLCLAICLSAIQIQAKDSQHIKHQTSFIAPKRNIKKNFPNIFSAIKYKIKRLFGFKPPIIYCPVANVSNVVLGASETVKDCSTSTSDTKSCSNNANNIKYISVFTTANDPDGDVLIYYYKVSAGKIIGNGEKVVWDLSDVAPGSYTITAAVDDGCGFCGRTVTKTVVVKECPDCQPEKNNN